MRRGKGRQCVVPPTKASRVYVRSLCVFGTVKPASRVPDGRKPAEVNVASVAPGRASRAIALNNRFGVHISGFFAGAKTVEEPASTVSDSAASSWSVVSLINIAKPQIQRHPTRSSNSGGTPGAAAPAAPAAALPRRELRPVLVRQRQIVAR